MATVLVVLGWVALALTILAGLILDLVGLFGNWVILAALGVFWAVSGYAHFGALGLGLMVGLAVLGEIIEALAAGFGAAKFGGNRGAVISALLGCIAGAIVGTPLFPLVGTVLGACVGAFGAAFAHELLLMRKDASSAAWTGFGAALGKVGGMLAKLIAGLAMLAVAVFTY